MSKVFLSYSRQSQETARNLADDIHNLGHVVWFDRELSGGHAWWDQILANIRDADVFVFVLDPDGLNSTACQREFGYAAALGKPVLPVLVAEGVSTNLLPPELSRLHFINCINQDRKSALDLAKALAGVPLPEALPDPLPAPPEVPVSYLGGLRRKIETSPGLSYEEQSALVLDLTRSLRDPKAADDTRVLLGKLKARRDLYKAIADDVDDLLGKQGPATAPPQAKPAPKPPSNWWRSATQTASWPPQAKPAPKPHSDTHLPHNTDATPSPAMPVATRSRGLWYLLVAALVVVAGIAYFAHPAKTVSQQQYPPQASPQPSGTARTKANPKDGLTYVWIQPGTFTMGCSPGDTQCDSDEKPAHQVTITRGFWMGQTDVTQEAYERVTGKNPSHFKGPKLPVETVNWNEAQGYCQAVGMRLPTEAEWEYAARAGTTGSRYGDLDQIAWYTANSGGKTHEVMQKQPNAWGLYDMLGNVFEWTSDWYADKYAGNAETDPQGPASGQNRVLRGGSWNGVPADLRASDRSGNEPGNHLSNLGFRCLGN